MKSYKGLIALLTFVLSFTAQAATKTWTGAVNNDWTNGGNWGGSAPVAGDIANIPGGLTNYPIINNTVTIATVNINSTGSGATITVTTSGTFNVTVLLTVNASGTFIHIDGVSNINALTVNGTATFSGGTMYSDGTLTVNSAGVVNQSGGLIHMAIDAITLPTDNLLIATGGTYNQSGGTLYIRDYTAGGGTFNQTGSTALFKVYHDWKPGTGSDFNSTAGTVQFTGPGGGGPDFSNGTRQFCNIIIDAAADPVFDNTAGAAIAISGNFTNNNSTLNVGTTPTFTFNGTSTQTIYSAVTSSVQATFGNLILNNPTTVQLLSNINCAGNLTIQQGTFDQNNYLANRTAAGGTLSMSSGTYLTAGNGMPNNFITGSFATNSTVIFNGSTSETIPAYNYYNLTSNNTGARILASTGTIGIAGTLSFSATNTYTITGSTINFNGTGSQIIPAFNYNNLTSSNTGARTLASSGTIGIAGTYTPGTNSYTITGSTIDYNGSGSQTITSFNYNNLTSSNSGSRTLAATGTIGVAGVFTPGSNSYTITGSTIEFNSNSLQTIPVFNYNNLVSTNSGARILASSGTIGIAGNFTPGTNSYTVTGSTVNYNGAGAQTIGNITYNNLSTSNSGTKSTNGSLTVNGTFTVNSPTILSPGAAHIINGTGTLTGNGTIQVTRIAATADLLSQYTISSINISSLEANYIGAGNQTVNALNYGNLTISTNGTRTVTLSGTGTIGVSGNFTATATTTTYVVTGSTVEFNGIAAQSMNAFTFNNLTLSNTGTKTTTGNIIINGTCTVTSPAVLVPGATNTVGGTGTLTGSGTVQVTKLTATPDFASQYTITNRTLSNLTIDYAGAGAQTINSTIGTYGHLKISGSGIKSLQGAITVSGNITVASGTLDVTTSLYGITLGGNWTNDAAAVNFTCRTGTVTFNGNSSSINGTAASQTFYNVVLSKTAGQTFTTGGSLASLTLNNYTQATGNFTGPSSLTINGNVILSSGTFTSGTNTDVAGNWTNDGATVATTGTINFSGLLKTISGSATGAFPILSVTGSVTMNNSNTSTDLVFPVNPLDASLTLGNGITLSVSGNITMNHTSVDKNILLNINAATVNVTGNVNIGSNVADNGRIAKIVITTGTLDITGDIHFNAAAGINVTAAIDMSGGTGLLKLKGSLVLTNGAGTLTPGANSTVEFYGTSAQSISGGGAITYNHIKINKTAGTVTQSSAITASGNLQVDQGAYSTSTSNYSLSVGAFMLNGGSLNLNSSSVSASGNYTNNNCIVSGGSFSLSVGGDFTRNGGTYNAGTSTITLAGNWVNNTSNTFTASSVTFTGTAKTISGTNAASFPEINITTGTITTNLNLSCTSLVLTNNAAANSFTIGNGITVTVNGNVSVNQSTATVIHSLNVNAGTLTINGNVTIAVNTNNVGRLARILITTGTLNITGDLTINNTILAANGIIDMSGGAGNLNLFGNFNLNTLGSLATGSSSTVTYLGTGSQSVAAVNYNNLIINKPSGTASLAGAITVTNVTLSQGTLSAGTGSYLITLSGNWINNGGTFSPGTGDVLLNGTGNIGGTGSTTFYDINISAASTGYTMSNNNNCNSLIFDVAATSTSFTHTGTASLNVAGVVTINQPTATATESWNINAGSATVGGLINFAGTNNGATRVGQITITTGTLNANGGISFAANTAPASKVIDMSGGAGTLNLKGSLTFGNLGGTLNAGTAGSIFNYADDVAAQTVNFFPAGAYHNLHINTTGSTGATLSAAITTTNVTGNLRVQSGTLSNAAFTIALNTSKTFEVANAATFKMTGTSGMVTGTSITKTFGATSTCDYNGAAQTVSAETYGHLILSNNGLKTLPGSAMTIQGNFTTSGTISTTAATSLTINGNVTLGNGTSLNEGTTTHNIGGNWTNNGATITTGTSTINFNGTSAQTLGGTAASLNMYNLTISNTTAAVTVNTNTNVSNTLMMNGAATLLSPAASVVFNNSGASGTITGTGTVQVTRIAATADYTNQYKFTTNTLTNLTVDFAGAGAQSVNAFTYGGLKCSGSGTKTASGNIVVNGTLTIVSGITLDMGTHTLSGTLAGITGTGILKTQNTSATPIPAGKTWTGDVYYNSSSAQSIVNANYNNLDGTGGNRSLASSGTIGISGTFTPGAGTYTITGSTIDFNGSSAQTIPAFTFNNITCSGGNTKNVGGLVNVINDLSIGSNTTLALGSNNIKLKSDSTYTARVATLPATAAITYGTGRFIAERYIKGRRKYRLITSPVTTSPNGSLTAGEAGLSIWGNWQNSGNNSVSNNGTFITGGNSSDGFDTQTTNASLFTYDAVNRMFTGFTTSNGKNTKFTPLKAGIPYYMFVWGDRTNSPITPSPNKTVLTSTGTLLTGDQTYNTSSSLPLSNTVNQFTMIGNPFASPIDWATISRTNLSDTYWGWDPNLNSTGGWVTVSSSGSVTLIAPFSGSVGLNQYIQSGQGFFVKTTASSPVLVIKESDKVSNYNANAFRTQANDLPLIAINLFPAQDNDLLLDGALVAFDPSYSNSVGLEDATKMRRPKEELAILHNNELLSIDARQMPAGNDSLQIAMYSLDQSTYRLQIFSNQLDSTTLEAWLHDRYLDTRRLLNLSDTNLISFDVNRTVPASFAADRFYIVFKNAGAPSDIITSILAVKENRTARVAWNVLNETHVLKYEIEKTANGGSFEKLGEVAATGATVYQLIDLNPAMGLNHYRVRVIKTDGATSFSRIASLELFAESPEIKIYPNPVKNSVVSLLFTNVEKGNYTAELFTIRGEAVFKKQFVYDGGMSPQLLELNKKYPGGLYIIKVYNQHTTLTQKIFIE